MEDSNADGIYECKVPTGYSDIIFVRINPDSSNASWDEGVKWGQSPDLTVPTGSNNHYYILGWENGEWHNNGYKSIYMHAGGSGLWDQDGAYFEAWSWTTESDGTWYSMFSNNEGLYQVLIPADKDNIIFVRRAPEHTSGSWNDNQRWNKTDDLKIPNGSDLYTITGWNGADGSWSKR